MAIQLGDDILLTQRELSEYGIRDFFKSCRLGTENYVSIQVVREKHEIDLSEFDIESYIGYDEACETLEMEPKVFDALLQGEELLPCVSQLIWRNQRYLSERELGKLDPRFGGQYLKFDMAVQLLETRPEILEALLEPEEMWHEPVAGARWLRSAWVEQLKKKPPFNKEQFVSLFEASKSIGIATQKLRDMAAKNRFKSYQFGSEQYIRRSTLETLRKEYSAL